MAGRISNAIAREDGMAHVAADGRGTAVPVLSGPGYDRLPPQLPVEQAYSEATRSVNALLDFSGDLSHRFRAAGLLPLRWAETLLARALRVMRLNYNALLGVLMCTVDGPRRQAQGVHAALLAMLAACQWGLPARSARHLGLAGLLWDWGGAAWAEEAVARQGQTAGEAAPTGAPLPTGPAHTAARERNAPEPGGARPGTQEQERLRGMLRDPEGAGESIALAAHLLATAREYAALISVRPGTGPLPPHQALTQMRARAASSLEREALEHFIRCLGVYPVGGVVQTHCGLRGLVIENSPDSPQLLTVRLLRPAAQRAAFGPEPSQIWRATQIATAYPLIPVARQA